MSNYQQTTFFTPKDSLPTTSPLKTIFGAAYDVEFGNIATAIATKVDNGSAVAVTIANTLTVTPTSANSLITAISATNANTGTAAGVQLQLTAGTTAISAFVQTQSGFTGTLATGGPAGAQFGLIGTSAAGTFVLGVGSIVQLTVGTAGNVTITAPTTGTSLLVNGVTGSNTIVGAVVSGGTALIGSTCAGGAGQAVFSATVSGSVAMNMAANNSGGTVNGIITGASGLTTTTATPLVLAVNSTARLTLGATASVAAAYNFAGSLLTTTATAGTNGSPPTQVGGYWNMQLNGTSVKVPYYNP